MAITVTILTKNCGETLGATLESLKSFDEVLILDSGSTDETLEIAKQFSNVEIVRREFLGFGKTHNLASSLAKNDWILSVDSDEILTADLIAEIQALKLDSHSVYAILRHNYFQKKQIRTCGGWHPDWVVRLYNRKVTHFSDDQVHEKVLAKGLKIVRLSHPMLHTPYRAIGDFLTKMQTYSSLFAAQNRGEKKASLLSAILHSWFAFFKSYIIKRGIFDGAQGYILSLYNAHTTFYKYLKLAETNSKKINS